MTHPLNRTALVLGLAATLLSLSGCGKSLDELLNLSQIDSASATPNPVPDPGAGRSTGFTLNVAFDSNNDDDHLLVYARNPDDSDRYVLIGLVRACDSGQNNCGLKTRTLACTSSDHVNRAGRRIVNCGESDLSLPVGRNQVRVDIDRCHGAPFGCDRSPDDSAEFTLTLQ